MKGCGSVVGHLHLKQKNEVSLIVMRNIREELAEIPLTFIRSITYDLTTFPTLTLEIPDQIERQNESVKYELYDKIKGKMVLILTINGKKSKFIIDEDIQETKSAHLRTKKLIAYGYEKTLEKKTFLISEGATRQLYCPEDETVEVSDGVLNWFVEQNPYWKIGYVDELARKEMLWFNETEEVSIAKKYTKTKVVVDGIVWSKSVSIKANRPFSITYQGLSSYLADKLQKSEMITHSFTLTKDITKISVAYTSSADYLYGADYTFTHSDGKTSVQRVGFTNVKDMKIEIEHLYLSVQTGEMVEQLTTRYRFFEQCSTTWYSFLMNEVADSYECVFEFDSYNQVLNCYHKDNYGNDSGLYMSYENGIQEINKTYKIGDTVSRLYVESPNVTIAEENPLGGEYVECFDYYIREGLMSNSLVQALSRYQTFLDKKQEEWLIIRQKKNKVDQQLTLKETELTSLSERYKYESALLSAYIKANETSPEQKEQSQLVEQLDKQIQSLMSAVQTLKDQADGYYQEMLNLGKNIAKPLAEDSRGKIFTELDLREIEEFTVEGSIQNDTYLTATGLYNYAKSYIEDLNDVAIDFTISTDNLIRRVVHPNGWQQVISLGERIWVDDADLLMDDKPYIQLTAFTFTPNQRGGEISSLTFTNNKQPASDIKTIGDIGRQSSQTSNLTNFWKDTWKQAQNNNVHVEKLLQEGLDAAAMAVRARNSLNKISITEAGIFIIDARDENNQICLMSSMIAITQDRWKTSQLALDANGVLANVIVGKLMMSDKLIIGNEDDTFVINPNGISIFDQNSLDSERIFLGLETVDGVKKARLRLHSAKDEHRLVLSEDGIYQVIPVHAMDNFDKDNGLECSFYIGDNIQSIHDFNVRLKLDKFRAYSKTSKSGGGVSTTKTSNSSGSISISSSTSKGGYLSKTTDVYYPETLLVHGVTTSETWNPTSEDEEPTIKNHRHNLLGLNALMEHNHTFVIPNHDHDFSVKQGGHAHEVSIEIDPHTHGMNYGIYEYSASPTVNVYLDSTLVASNVTASKTYNLTSKAQSLTKGWHTIRVVGVSTTANTDGLGRASIDASIGAFVSF